MPRLIEMFFWPNGYGTPPRVPISVAVKLYPTDPRIVALMEGLNGDRLLRDDEAGDSEG